MSKLKSKVQITLACDVTACNNERAIEAESEKKVRAIAKEEGWEIRVLPLNWICICPDCVTLATDIKNLMNTGAETEE